MSKPLVSIVTPSYNQRKFLETTLRSVIGQDYPVIEHIVIDGGSDDGSVDLIKRYADRLAHWESKSDHGQADAINKGLRIASGEFIGWLNSDDVYLPGAVEEAVSALVENPDAGMAYGNGLMVDENLRLLDPHRYPQLSLSELLAFEVLLQPAVFMRRKALEEVGFLNGDYDLILDHELWVRIASQYSIVHVDSFWALERTHDEAKTIASAAEFVREAERMLAWARQSPYTQQVYQSSADRIEAGFHVFAARRLIDAESFAKANQHLRRAWGFHPRTVLRYWYKVVQAALSALGLAEVFLAYRRWRRRLQFGELYVDPERPLRQQPALRKKVR